jgi:DNA invertase Pin-like site-specific DNA recombinase
VKENEGRVITNKDIADKTRVGYIRCSHIDQNEARQLSAFEPLSLYRIYIEKASAKSTDRPILKQLLDYVRDGDCVYIKDFSRLARNVKDLLEITEDLNNRGVTLISLQENLDLGTATGQLLLKLLGSVYEFERAILLERQREGIAIAKREGKFKGRKEIERPADWDEVYGLYKTRELTAKEAMKRLNLKRTTFYKFVNGPKQGGRAV